MDIYHYFIAINIDTMPTKFDHATPNNTNTWDVSQGK